MSTRILEAGDYGVRPWGALLTNGSSSDANVDGSSTPVELNVQAQSGKMVHIQCVKFEISTKYGNIDSRDILRFGAATQKETALANGLELGVTQNSSYNEIFSVKTMKDLVLYSDGIINLNNYDGSNDLVIITVPFKVPVMLANGAQSDKLSMIVSDDLTELGSFRVLACGFTEDK